MVQQPAFTVAVSVGSDTTPVLFCVASCVDKFEKEPSIIRQMPRLFSNDSSDQQDAATASDSSSNLVLSSLDRSF